VRGIREVEVSLGSPVKSPSAAERENMLGMRRSIVTRVAISAGTVLRRDLVAFKRPATGLPPARLAEVLGRTARTDLAPDTPLQWGHLE
jgi:sialic acid synthase SpsE